MTSIKSQTKSIIVISANPSTLAPQETQSWSIRVCKRLAYRPSVDRAERSGTYLSQGLSLGGVEVQEESAEEVVVQHQLFPRHRPPVAARSSARQRHGHLHSVSGYPGSARSDVVQAFLIVGRRHIVDGLRGTPVGLLRHRVRIIRALQIHVSDAAAAAAEDVRHAFHDAGLPATCKRYLASVLVQCKRSRSLNKIEAARIEKGFERTRNSWNFINRASVRTRNLRRYVWVYTNGDENLRAERSAQWTREN